MSYRVTIWTPLLTAHSSHTYHALAERGGYTVHVVSSRESEPIRRAQGWTTDNAPVSHEILPRRQWRERVSSLLSDADPSHVHIFCSPFELAKQSFAMFLAAKRGRTFFLISEPYLDQALSYLQDKAGLADKIKATLRPLVYSVYARLLKDRAKGIFAISQKAVRQFSHHGFLQTQIFPFGYFVNSGAGEPVPERSGPVRVVYLGSFIQRKGIPLLLAAFANERVQRTGATLDLYGPRSAAITGLTLPPGARYAGPLPFGAVQEALRQYDIIVVPSLSDGWAVVVNEGVQAGLAVIVSDAVGSAPMVARWDCGTVFRSGDQEDLSRKLVEAIGSPDLLDRQRAAARALTPHIHPQSAAAYLDACLRASIEGHAPPPAPWY